MSNLPADHAVRQQALSLNESFCVQAPAGSGKTELLTQRYLALLASCDKPEEILAITFTRKAASEMRNRILEQMAQAKTIDNQSLDKLPPHQRSTLELARKVLERDREKQWQLLANTARLRISTIDSFNAFLTGQLPIVSELGVMPEVVTDANPLYEEAVLDLLSELESGTPIASTLSTLLLHTNNQWRTLSGLLCGLLANREQWLGNILDIKSRPDQARHILEQTLETLIEVQLLSLSRALAPYLPELHHLLSFAAENLEKEGNTILSDALADSALPVTSVDALPAWHALGNILLTSEHQFRKTVNKSQGFPAQGTGANSTEKALYKENKDRMLSMLADMAGDESLRIIFEEFRHLPAPSFPDNHWKILECLTLILPELVSRLLVVFGRHGQTDYSQISIAALTALGLEDAPTDLALRLDYQLQHILVDEFQDTSILQNNLLEKLTLGWQPGDGRTLFIVGDGMQSCYGFRNANVGLFLTARDKGIGSISLIPLQLTSNFRSQANVVEWVNHWFNKAFPPADDISRGAVSFSPASPIHDPIPKAGVTTCILTADKEDETASTWLREREAQLVAEKVADFNRDYPDESIAILVRTRSHLESIIPALRARNLRWHAAEIDPLYSYPAVRDLLMLTRSLLNLADITAWLAVLRSPMIGLSISDIHQLSLVAQQSQTTLWQTLAAFDSIDNLQDETRTILERICPIIEHARTHHGRVPLRDWIETTWIALGGPATLDTPDYLDSILHFLRLLDEADNGGDITDITRFESEVNREYGDGLDPEAHVTLMTLHKAKGLEFHHVIIPGLERKPRADGNPLLRWREYLDGSGNTKLILSMPPERGQKEDATYQHLRYEAGLQQRFETTRLFYIGVTRAIKNAVLIGSVMNKEGSFTDPNKNSLLASLWPHLSSNLDENATVIPVNEPVDKANDKTTVPAFLTRRLPVHWKPSVPLLLDQEDDLSHLRPETVHDNLLARFTGNILHDCLHRIGEGRLSLDDQNARNTLSERWRETLAPLTETPDKTISLIFQQLENCRHHVKFPWMLLEEHSQAASELSLSDFRASYRRQLIVDRTFIDDNGIRWIIDFKSTVLANDISREEFLARESDLYRPQLEEYATLFLAMEDREVRTALFFTSLPCFHEVTLDATAISTSTPENGQSSPTGIL